MAKNAVYDLINNTSSAFEMMAAREINKHISRAMDAVRLSN
jgi:hypothetical protein